MSEYIPYNQQDIERLLDKYFESHPDRLTTFEADPEQVQRLNAHLNDLEIEGQTFEMILGNRRSMFP